MKRAFLILIILSLECCSATAATRAQKTPTPNSLIVGVETHETTNEGIRLLKDAHVEWIRDDTFWESIETKKGKLIMDKSRERYIHQLVKEGIQPLLILDYGNEFYDHKSYPKSPKAIEGFTRFCEFVVKHFKGKVHAYEVWNEWNGGCGMQKEDGLGKPEDYVALLKHVYPRLKKMNPSLTILGGGTADSGNDSSNPWLEKACKLGLLNYCDGVSIHPYCYTSAPEYRIPEKGFLNRCRSIFKILEKYKRDIPVYITEVGWPNHDHEDGSSVSSSANYLARTYFISATFRQIKGVWWYDLSNDGLDSKYNEHNFGILYHDLTPKPSYFVLQDIAEFLKEYRFVERIRVDDDSVYVLRFANEKNQPAWAAWCITPRNPRVVAMESKIFLPISMKRVGSREIKCSWMPAEGKSSYQLRFTVDETPLLITFSGNLEK